MSRKKGFTAKLADGDDFDSRLNHAVFGDDYNENTKPSFDLVKKLNDLAWEYHLDNSPETRDCDYRPRKPKAYYRKQIATAGETLINEIADAIEKNDCSFFRGLADAVGAYARRRANQYNHASPARAALLLFGQSNFLITLPRKLKIRELQEIVERRAGMKLDRRQIQRLCKELKIDKHTERGRPKKGDN